MIDYAARRELADRVRARSAQIAEEATEAFVESHPDWVDRYGDAVWVRGREDAVFHVEFLAGAIVTDQPAAFADYARWTAGMLSARGIEPRFLAENLEQVARSAVRDLDEAQRAVVERVVATGVAAIGERAPGAGMHEDGERLRVERSLFTQALRIGDRRAALRVAHETVRAGMSVPELYVEVLQPAQYEIGRLWEHNEITVAQEHMATAITQYVVAQMYSHMEFPESTRGNALVTGVRGELHQLGANMVADVLEADGWNMRFLGTQLPHRTVLDEIEAHQPVLIGISATILFNLPAVGELIESTRKRFGDGVHILVGGGAFRSSPDIWRDMGADGYGKDLREAVRVASGFAAGAD